MGLDFLRRTAKASTKAWDRGKAELSNPSLFTQQPDCQTRSVLADLNDGSKPRAGEAVTLHMQDQGILVVRENTQIGRVTNPPADLVKSMRNAGGCALAEIRTVNPLSGTGDIDVK